jgi:hypothetical protein
MSLLNFLIFLKGCWHNNMLFYYIVVEIINGKKQQPVMLDDAELKQKIETLRQELNSEQYSIITEKAGWYRISYGDRKNYLRYKRS